MTWLAGVARDHPVELAATMRELYGVPWHAAGGPDLPWAEALSLVRAAVADTSTRLGAAHAGWAWPASQPQLLALLLQAPDQATARTLLPFDLEAPAPGESAHHDALVAQAQADLEASIHLA
mgnify:FL=1